MSGKRVFRNLINYLFFYFLFFTFIYIDKMGRTQKNHNVVEVGNIQVGFLSEKIDNFFKMSLFISQ